MKEKVPALTRQPGIMKGDTLQKVSSAAFIGGAGLMLIGGSLLPHAATATSNVQDMLKPLGEQLFLTQLSVLLLIASVCATLLGVAGIYRFIVESGANKSGVAWARGSCLHWRLAIQGSLTEPANLSILTIYPLAVRMLCRLFTLNPG